MLNRMVEDDETLNAVFRALAHTARRSMLRRLVGGQLTVSELAAPLRMSLTAASKHVKVLEHSGLIHRTIVGRSHVCRLRPTPLSDAVVWLRIYEQFWDARPETSARSLP